MNTYFEDYKDYSYKNVECKKLTEDEIKECAQLFSEHYGKWSNQHKGTSINSFSR